MLIIFSGASGAGKNTVITELLKSDDFALLPTYTTREKRDGETEGSPYCYLTEAEFKNKIAEGELYEYENVHGHFYGTSKLLLKQKSSLGKILLKDIDVLGTQNLVKLIGNDIKIVTVFLKVDSREVLKERLIERKETEIDKRLSRYDLEMTYCDKYDYIITNNDLKETINSVLDTIRTEKQKFGFSVATPFVFDDGKVKEYVKKLENGETLSPVKISYADGKPYIVDGAYKYLAGVISGKHVAKELVCGCEIKSCSQESWREALKKAVAE